jgi:RNA polymerase sigma-70 factor (ECF subfamily)
VDAPFLDALDQPACAAPLDDPRSDLESIFHAQYPRVFRIVARVLKDPARAEEVAVEVFLKWARSASARKEAAEGWLYRAAVRRALDEIRRQTRRSRYERLFGFLRGPARPDELLEIREKQRKVRQILGAMDARQAELLLLRSQGFSYEELASTLGLNSASVGVFLSRAQQKFRKEYIKRYGLD